MTGRTQKSARVVAAEVLNRLDLKKDYASTILSRFLEKTNQKQRATDLVFGSIRNRWAIDMVISKLSSRSPERIPDKILNIIRIGVYELICCPGTALHAIVNEAVEQIKTIAGKKQVGFVNAVLRQITRHIKNRRAELAKVDIATTLPQSAEYGCEFDIKILPNPADHPADNYSSAYSLPKWLVQQWLDDYGGKQTRQICQAANRKPALYIRVNTLVTTTEDLNEQFRQAGIDSKIINTRLINIKSPASVTLLPGYEQGLFSVQDMTASLPVKLLDPQPNWKILDLCAAPGGKTTQLAELTNDKATIIVTDIDNKRLRLLNENIDRLKLHSVTVINYKDLQKTVEQIGPFDGVLLDVPCSNTGVLARRPEVRYRINRKAIEAITKTQAKLLEKASKLVKPGGRICYSTCSIQNDENGLLIKHFLKNRSFELVSETLTLPCAQKDHDGGYSAVLINTAE
ncbi:MAG: 16S rRNA (cytosine(967)-C(5))-methyltransferase RsmB [Planctomycetota bacterium]|jgi:16S rRNA (cytosine967-C5)-methyltransferase